LKETLITAGAALVGGLIPSFFALITYRNDLKQRAFEKKHSEINIKIKAFSKISYEIYKYLESCSFLHKYTIEEAVLFSSKTEELIEILEEINIEALDSKARSSFYKLLVQLHEISKGAYDIENLEDDLGNDLGENYHPCSSKIIQGLKIIENYRCQLEERMKNIMA